MSPFLAQYGPYAAAAIVVCIAGWVSRPARTKLRERSLAYREENCARREAELFAREADAVKWNDELTTREALCDSNWDRLHVRQEALAAMEGK